MKYFVAVLMALLGYYTLTYGISQWRSEKNRLGGFGTILFAVVGTVIPIIVLIIRL